MCVFLSILLVQLCWKVSKRIKELSVNFNTFPPILWQVTVGPSSSSTDKGDEASGGESSEVFMPPPRINAGMVVKKGILYLYGGIYEDGDKQLTLGDFYALGKESYMFQAFKWCWIMWLMYFHFFPMYFICHLNVDVIWYY